MLSYTSIGKIQLSDQNVLVPTSQLWKVKNLKTDLSVFELHRKKNV